MSLLNTLTDFLVAASELFAKSPTDRSAEEAALCLTKFKDASSGPNSCYYCKKNSDALIGFGRFYCCRPCMKREMMKSDKANAARPFIRQEKIHSKVESSEQEQSVDGNAEGNDSDEERISSMDIDEEAEGDDSDGDKVSVDDVDEEAEGNDSDGEKVPSMDIDEEAEGNDSDGDKSSVDDVDEEAEGDDSDGDKVSVDDVDEEAEGNDSDGDKSSVDDVDEEAEGNDSDGDKSSVDDVDEEAEGNDSDDEKSAIEDLDVGAGNPSGREAFKLLLATTAQRPPYFEAMSVFQEIIRYTIYQPFDTIQPFDAGKTKHYVSSLVWALLAYENCILDGTE